MKKTLFLSVFMLFAFSFNGCNNDETSDLEVQKISSANKSNVGVAVFTCKYKSSTGKNQKTYTYTSSDIIYSNRNGGWGYAKNKLPGDYPIVSEFNVKFDKIMGSFTTPQKICVKVMFKYKTPVNNNDWYTSPCKEFSPKDKGKNLNFHLSGLNIVTNKDWQVIISSECPNNNKPIVVY